MASRAEARAPRRWVSPLRSARAGALLAALMGASIHAHALSNGFAYDDVAIVAENPDLRGGVPLADLLARPYWSGAFGRDGGLWRPVTTGALALQWRAWGDRPALFHLVNVLLHGAVAGLVVLVLAALAPPRVAFLGGLLFAVHPVHVEAVANVVGLAEVLAGGLALGACLLHLRAPREGYGARRLLGVAALYALAFGAKESAAVLPALLLLLDAAREKLRLEDAGRYLARRGHLYVLLGAVAAALLVGRYAVLGRVAEPLPPLGAELLASGVPRVWTVAQVWAHWVRLMVFPVDLSADYSPAVVPVALGWTPLALAGALLALGALVLARVAWRGPALGPSAPTPRVVTLAVLWFVVAAAPVGNVLFLSGVLLAERTLYLPSFAVAAAGGWVLHQLLRRRGAVGVAAVAVVIALLSVRTAVRVPVWRDTDSVMADLLERHPEAGRGWLHLAGRLAAQGRGVEARRAASVALQLTGAEYALVTQVALWMSAMDDAAPAAAEALLERAWRQRPGVQTAPGYLAIHHLNHGSFARGLAPARAAVALAPENPDARWVLGSLLSGAGRPAEALRHRLAAVERGRDGWTVRARLAAEHAALGDTAAARAALDEARRLAPDPASVARVRQEAARLLGSAPPPPGQD